jgi:O-antigen/teichoic acid export membrane protein
MAPERPPLADPAPARPAGSFLGNVNIVIATYAADGALALATGALMARALGPDGRGAYSLFVLSAAFGQLLLGLGTGNAAIYYLNKREMSLRDALAAIHVVALASVVVAAAVAGVVAPLAGGDAFGRGISPWLLAAAVPILLYMNLLRLMLQAQSRFIDLGVATVGQQTLILAMVAVAYAYADPSPSDMVWFLLIASAATALYALVRIGIAHLDVARVVRPRFGALRSLVRFGAQGEAGNVLQALNYRLDQYIVRGFAGLGAVGIYAVGVSLTEGVFILANAVALVLLPRLTSMPADEASSMTPVASRNTLLIAAVGSFGLAAVAPLLLPAIYGARFGDSVQALWLLLPGTVALTGSKVLTSYIFSQGRPLVNTGVTAISLAVTLAADLALIPAFGANGAAAASSIGYSVHFVAALAAYQRLSGQPALAAVLPQLHDARLYIDAARGFVTRFRGRAQLPAGG